MDIKPGQIVFNPFYSEEMLCAWKSIGRVSEVDEYDMLCIVEKVFIHPQREGGMACRLVSIHRKKFISNVSLVKLISVQ